MSNIPPPSWAVALRGEIVGNAVSCPGPGHPAHDRSLSGTVFRRGDSTPPIRVKAAVLRKTIGKTVSIMRAECWDCLGEGLESSLSVHQHRDLIGNLPWSAIWAAASSDAVQSFPLLENVETLTILAETGDGGASEKAIKECRST